MTGATVRVNRSLLTELLELAVRAPIQETDVADPLVVRQCIYCGEQWECRVTDHSVTRESHDYDCPIPALFMSVEDAQ